MKPLTTILLAFALSGHAYAFNIPPFATDHEAFLAMQGNPNTTPESCVASTYHSPVNVSTGNLAFRQRLLLVNGVGPSLGLALTYNSQDMRQGPTGHGWRNSYDTRLVVATDGAQVVAICGQPGGNRDRFVRQADGSYTSPAGVRSILIQNTDGSHSLIDKNRQTRRFNQDGRLITIEDRYGNAETLAYDSTGFLQSVSDASGRSINFTKGASGLVDSVTDPASRVFHFVYDSAGNLTEVADPSGRSTKFQYTSASQMTKALDPNGNQVIGATYDSNGRVATLSEGDRSYVYTYSPSQRQTTKRETTSATAYVYTYNELGSVIKTVDPLGNTETVTYDIAQNVIATTDRNGNTSLFTYDGAGNPISYKDGKGSVRTVSYDTSFNVPVTTTDPLGNVTRFKYDAHGQLTDILDPSGAHTQIVYNQLGQLTEIKDPSGRQSFLIYDEYGNVIAAKDASGNVTTATYDILGRQTSVKDPNGRISRFEFGSNGKVNRTIGPDGQITTNVFDAAGRLTGITLPNSAKTTFEFDSLGRISKTVNALTQTVSYSYDARGNLSTVTNARGQQIAYTYDSAHRLIQRSFPGRVVNYEYDKNGNLTAVRTARSVLAFTYDSMNRALTASTGPAPTQPTTSLQYGYDLDGNRSLMKDSLGDTTSYVYDERGLLASLTDSSGLDVSFKYDELGRRSLMTRTGGVTSAYSYDSASRLTALSHSSVVGSLSFAYSYDSSGNRLSRSDNDGAHSYSYDNNNHLVGAASPSDNEVYVYDQMGNRVNSHLSSTYSYDLLNRLTADDTFGYTYDADGNLVTKVERATSKVTRYIYDAESRLTQIVFADGTMATYEYDGLGRRIEKNVRGQITRFVYDGVDVVAEYDGTNTMNSRFVAGPVVDELLAVHSDALYIIEADAAGSIVRSESAGKSVSTAVYDSFGRTSSQTGTRVTSRGFQGRDFDVESGLYYFRARYYDPNVGRFVSPDPSGYSGGLNLYSFVNSNPTSLVDPSGKNPVLLFIYGCAANPACVEFVAATGVFVGSVAAQLFENGGHVSDVNFGEAGELSMAATMGMSPFGATEAAGEQCLIADANFAQRTYRQLFSSGGTFAGRTVEEVAAALRSGELTAIDVPIQYIIRDGNTLILNTRSAQALEQAGIPRGQWSILNLTGDAAAEARLTEQLERNGLGSSGIPSVTPNN